MYDPLEVWWVDHYSGFRVIVQQVGFALHIAHLSLVLGVHVLPNITLNENEERAITLSIAECGCSPKTTTVTTINQYLGLVMWRFSELFVCATENSHSVRIRMCPAQFTQFLLLAAWMQPMPMRGYLSLLLRNCE